MLYICFEIGIKHEKHSYKNNGFVYSKKGFRGHRLQQILRFRINFPFCFSNKHCYVKIFCISIRKPINRIWN